MSNAKHTPGPWHIVFSERGYPYAIRSDAPGVNKPGAIRDITRWAAIGLPSSQEGLANARLIAASPEMFEALEAVIEANRSYREVNPNGARDALDEACDAARAALAKAKGEA